MTKMKVAQTIETPNNANHLGYFTCCISADYACPVGPKFMGIGGCSASFISP